MMSYVVLHVGLSVWNVCVCRYVVVVAHNKVASSPWIMFCCMDVKLVRMESVCEDKSLQDNYTLCGMIYP